MGKWMYRFMYSWLRHYLDVSGQLPVTAVLSLGKEPSVPIGEENVWAPEPA
jgi:hypothetical protein